MINAYGKDKLKNLASYKKHSYYPIIHKWVDRHSIEPRRKFIYYFAIPDDRGNVFVIPSKWCEDIHECNEYYTLTIDLNEQAIEQLNKAGKFTGKQVHLIDHVWEDNNPHTEQGKKKFDIFFAILDEDKHIFIVQSTWGKVVILNDKNQPVYA